jgi:transcriptional regulator with XRE-family HTH domain
MRSPLHSDKYELFLEELNDLRARAGISQTELAARMGVGQDLISRCESGRRRVDIFELGLWTHACGSTLQSFVKKLDARIRRNQLPSLLKPGEGPAEH